MPAPAAGPRFRFRSQAHPGPRAFSAVSGVCTARRPSFVQDDLRIGAIAAILTNQDEIFICDNAVTAVLICPFDLISQIDIVVLQKPDCGSVGKRIRQIHVRTGQQIQVGYRKPLDAESVDLPDQLTLQQREVLVSLSNAAAAEGMPPARIAASALRQPAAFLTAILSAKRRHAFSPFDTIRAGQGHARVLGSPLPGRARFGHSDLNPALFRSIPFSSVKL